MLSRRQIDVQRSNLASMCRIAVKSLLDYACLNSHIDEDCEEFINFCAVFEQMVSHRLRPYQKRVWHRGQGTPRHFWEVLVENHNHGNRTLFSSCIPNLERIENIKSPKAKLRAFLRVALMEKRLSEYLIWVLDNLSLIQECYMDGALITSEEGTVLCGDLIGLNAIDFNFCLKGNENELMGPLEINYAPFLQHKQSLASQTVDEEEMLRLSGKVPDNANANAYQSDSNETVKLQNLEKEFRSVKEQKEYLEELVRLRESQLADARVKIETLQVTQERKENDWMKERQILDACILELQGAMSGLQTQNGHLRHKVSVLQEFKDRFEMRNVPLIEMAYGPDDRLYPQIPHEQQGQRSQMSTTASGNDAKSTLPDQRSIHSSTSDQIRLKEDSHSMRPLTGSLADVNVAMLKDQPVDQEKDTKTVEIKSQPERVILINAETSASDSLQEETPMISSAMTESYVMADIQEEHTPPSSSEDDNAKMMSTLEAVTPNDAGEQGCGEKLTEKANVHEVETIQDQQSPTGNDCAAFIEQKGAANDVMTISDGGVSTSSSGPSDPEILEHANISSDGSDAAWEMLSDSEQADHGHQA